MKDYTLKERLESLGIGLALNMIKDDPDKNLPKLMRLIDKFDVDDEIAVQREALWGILNDPDNHWNKFIKSFWADIDDDVRNTVFENLIVRTLIVGSKRQQKAQKENGCNIPLVILLDPTSACNLNCTGCWAAEYGNALNMTFDEMNGIVTQGKKLGTFFYLFSGGEPLVRKKDIIRLCEEHDDCMFAAFTNGTLIDEEFADEMLRVKNFAPCISIEGFEEATDARRGKGTYQKAISAMEILKDKKLLFGASCCYTSQNTDVIGSEEYIDDLIALGCKFAWFFTYMPVGVGAPTELIATAEQRKYMYRQLRSFREGKALFTMDFWNDGEYAGGCIAGGRTYLHISAGGDIEPCAFIHYSDSNIREKTLLEAYKSPLFMEYYKNQPFSHNLLRPCPLLDNNGKLAEMVHASGAHSTDMSAPEDVDELCAKCSSTAANWEPVADELWAESHGACVGCAGCGAAAGQ